MFSVVGLTGVCACEPLTTCSVASSRARPRPPPPVLHAAHIPYLPYAGADICDTPHDSPSPRSSRAFQTAKPSRRSIPRRLHVCQPLPEHHGEDESTAATGGQWNLHRDNRGAAGQERDPGVHLFRSVRSPVSFPPRGARRDRGGCRHGELPSPRCAGRVVRPGAGTPLLQPQDEARARRRGEGACRRCRLLRLRHGQLGPEGRSARRHARHPVRGAACVHGQVRENCTANRLRKRFVPRPFAPSDC